MARGIWELFFEGEEFKEEKEEAEETEEARGVVEESWSAAKSDKRVTCNGERCCEMRSVI